MKKLLTTISAMAVGAGSLLAQGTIDFHNPTTLKVLITADNVVTNSLGSAAATSATGVTAGQVNVALLVRPAGGSFIQVGQVLTSATGPFVGTFNGGNPFVLPTQAGFAQGNVVDFEFEAWSVSTGAASYAAAKNATTGYISQVLTGTGYVLAGGSTSPSATFGTGAGQVGNLVLTQVPEPSTLALGALGVASLAFFRRRK
jgi:hypothetical protein